MNNSSYQVFNRIYILFFFVFTILVSAYIGYILLVSGTTDKVLMVTCIFAAIMFLTGIIFILILKLKVKSMIKTINDIYEGAINGHERITDYSETALSALENKIVRHMDISRTKEKNIEAEKDKIKALISDISHQTKTPLSNIILYSQLLLESSRLDEDLRHIADSIKVQSDKLDWLIQSLVKMSRLETGIISIEQAVKPIVQTLTKAISQVYTKAEEKNMQITIVCDERIVAFHDIKWTGEAIFNILENAVKYTEVGGKICVSVVAYELFIRIDIADKGIGIEENELTNIFKRFYRCKSTSMYEGVGIGLYLSREIINFQGGYIKVSSKVGKGTVFSVFLPKTEK